MRHEVIDRLGFIIIWEGISGCGCQYKEAVINKSSQTATNGNHAIMALSGWHVELLAYLSGHRGLLII